MKVARVTRNAIEIAAVLIVRNEERCIARCLNSVAPWVDRMVVLDTGSADGTVAIAQELGAEVHHLPWPESFAEARNEALRLADADWNLVIDADEWIIDGGEGLRAWCESAVDRLGAPCIHNQTEGGGVQFSWITRLVPRGVYYEGRVREQFVSPLPRQRIALAIGHDGDLAPQLARKKDRYHPLLLADLADRPDDAYLLYQVGKDAQMRGDDQTACEFYAQALDASPLDANWRHDLVINTLHMFAHAGHVQAALTIAESEMPHWQRSPDFYFAMGDLFLKAATAEPQRALDHWLPLAEGAWERCLVIGERPDLEGSVPGRGSLLAQHNLDLLRSQLATLAA